MKPYDRKILEEYGFEEVPVFQKNLQSGLSIMVAELEDKKFLINVLTEDGKHFIDYTVDSLWDLKWIYPSYEISEEQENK